MIALDIVKASLRFINSYQPGETIATPDLNDCMEALNDLLDSWSTEKLHVFGTNEYILQWVNNQSQYKIGNPLCTDIGEPPIAATVVGLSNQITAVSTIPADLSVGANVTDSANVFPAGTTVTQISGTTITLSNAATASPSGTDLITYSIPGDFGIPRPLRITGGFTRINELDFWLDVYTSQDEYNAILFKAQPGPWPTVAWYNNQFPYGILNVYQTPGQSAELHLFTDTILSNLTAQQTVVLPQGYARALKWCLAKEICAQYGYPISEAITVNAAESLKVIKALNAQPAKRSRYDRELVRGNRPDGGWIIHGGFNY